MPKRFIDESEYIQLASMDMGKRIRFLREIMGQLYGKDRFTTTELAKQVNVSPQSLTAIERGESQNPSFKVIYNLSRIFNVPIDCLTDDYYNNPDKKLFSVGFDDDNNPSTLSEENAPPIREDNKFKIRHYILQIFNNGEARIVLDEKTKSEIDVTALLQAMARVYSEIQLLDRPSTIGQALQYAEEEPSPLKKALNRYKAILQYPKAFPRGKQETWDNLVNSFIEEAQYLSEQKQQEVEK